GTSAAASARMRAARRRRRDCRTARAATRSNATATVRSSPASSVASARACPAGAATISSLSASARWSSGSGLRLMSATSRREFLDAAADFRPLALIVGLVEPAHLLQLLAARAIHHAAPDHLGDRIVVEQRDDLDDVEARDGAPFFTLRIGRLRGALDRLRLPFPRDAAHDAPQEGQRRDVARPDPRPGEDPAERLLQQVLVIVRRLPGVEPRDL